MILARWVLTSDEYRQLGIHDNYSIHQLVCNIFDTIEVKFDFSTSNNLATIYIQCSTSIVNIPLIGKFESKEVDLSKCSSGKYRLMVKVNATKQRTVDGKRNKSIVPVVGEVGITDWLKRKQIEWGINITDIISIAPTVRTKGYQKKTGKVIIADWHSANFLCEVVDPTLFQNMINSGIGRGKSIGCGLIKFFKISD